MWAALKLRYRNVGSPEGLRYRNVGSPEAALPYLLKRVAPDVNISAESAMTGKWHVALPLALGLTSIQAAPPAIVIDAASPAGRVSPLFYGLMTEEINHAYDGGLYAELLRNRAFLDDASTPAHWSLVQGDGAAATMALDPKEPLNTSIGTSLRLDVTQAST